MRWLLALCLSLLAGCAQVGAPRESTPQGFAPWQAMPPEYRLGPGDEIEVRLIYNPELSDRMLIGPDGRISLPVVGTVVAEGKTTDELALELKKLYRKELRKPEVTVIGRTFASQRVLVGGEVLSPGVYGMTGRIGVLQAAMLAGGFRDTARLDRVVLIRRGPNDRPMLRVVDAQAILEGAGAGADVPLMPYDVVFVPRSSIAEVNLWVDQYVTRVLPFGRSFSYSINRNMSPSQQ